MGWGWGVLYKAHVLPASLPAACGDAWGLRGSYSSFLSVTWNDRKQIFISVASAAVRGLSAAGGSAGFLHDRIPIRTYFPQNEWSCNCGLLCLFLMWLLNTSHESQVSSASFSASKEGHTSCFPHHNNSEGAGKEGHGLPRGREAE